MSRETRVERAEYRAEAGREWCRALPRPCANEGGGVLAWYLDKRELDTKLARANGWYTSVSAGDGETRIVIPASSRIPGNVFWQARATDPAAVPRYQSPHAPRGDAIVVVWPQDHGITHSVVCEGPMDALAAAGEGCLGIALMGVTPPDLALDLTAVFCRGTMVTLVADNDALGAATKTVLKLVGRGLGVRLVSPAPYKDLADAPASERRRILG